jgi:hypothetical protein
MTTIDDSLSEIRSVRNDIWRCRKLLQTDLPEAEREMIEKRLLEQRLAFEGLLASTPFGVEALKQLRRNQTRTSWELSGGRPFGR